MVAGIDDQDILSNAVGTGLGRVLVGLFLENQDALGVLDELWQLLILAPK